MPLIFVLFLFSYIRIFGQCLVLSDYKHYNYNVSNYLRRMVRWNV